MRTAFQVARMGTVSGAAEVLGVHHATVIRHIDALEARLNVKLFQRHARGYTPTEAGQDLQRVASATDDQFGQLLGRIKGRGSGVAGELVVTSLMGFSGQFVPALASFQAEYPDVVVRFLTGDRLFRLEYGEAHVAIRAGAAPDQPDNVVQPFVKQRFGMYATKTYMANHDIPKTEAGLAKLHFVAHDDPSSRAPFFQWLRARVPEEAIRFRCSDFQAMEAAVFADAGVGFLPVARGEAHSDLVEIWPVQDEWAVQLWLVTHVDLHRTAKVQAFLIHFKSGSKSWDI